MKNNSLSLAVTLFLAASLGPSTIYGQSPSPSLPHCLSANSSAVLGSTSVNSAEPYVADLFPRFPVLRTLDEQLGAVSVEAATIFGLRPSFRLYDDGQFPNAFATSVTSDGFPDGSIRLGVKLVVSETRAFMLHQWGQQRGYAFTITAVIAHELAHLAQFKAGNATPGRNTELQADYLAGWYFARLNQMAPGHFQSNQALKDGVYAFFSRGDYQFNSPNHHGTREQRRDAFMAGFEAGPKIFADAWSDSVAYRSSL